MMIMMTRMTTVQSLFENVSYSKGFLWKIEDSTCERCVEILITMRHLSEPNHGLAN